MTASLKTLAVAGLGLLASATSARQPGGGFISIHVDMNAAPGGTGSPSMPFQTLEEARDEIRAIKSANGGVLPADVTVSIHEGVYELDEPFLLEAQDGGGNRQVTYSAAPLLGGGYESVLISGGEPLTQNWQEGGVQDPDGDEANSKWWGNVDLDREIRDLWVNNIRLTPARYPDSADAAFLDVVAGFGHYAIPFDPSCLDDPVLDLREYLVEVPLPALQEHNGNQNLVVETVSRIQWTQSRQRWVQDSLNDFQQLWLPEVLHNGGTFGGLVFDSDLPLSAPFCYANVHGPGWDDDNLDQDCKQCEPALGSGYPGDALYFERNWTFLTDQFEWIQFPEGYPGIPGEMFQPPEFKINMLLPDDQQAGGIDPRAGATVAPRLEQIFVARGASQQDPITSIRVVGLNFAFTHQPFPETDVTLNSWFAEWADCGEPPCAPTGILPGAFSGQAGNRPGEGQMLLPAVEFSNAMGCEIIACRVAHTGGDGIWVHGWENDVVGNEVFDTGGHGIHIGWRYPGLAKSQGIKVAHNYVHDFGVVYHGHVGINAFVIDGAIIQHNDVAYGPWCGIHMMNGFCGDSQGICTDISFNAVWDVVLLHKDGDGIYVNGTHSNAACASGYPRLSENYVENIGFADGAANGVHGIRIDNSPPPPLGVGWNISRNVVSYSQCPFHVNLISCDRTHCPEDHVWESNYFWIDTEVFDPEVVPLMPFVCVSQGAANNCPGSDGLCDDPQQCSPVEWVQLGNLPQTWPQEAIDIANASGPDFNTYPNLNECEPLVHADCP